MKKIDIEKGLDLRDIVDIISLDMKDSFTYQKEEGGLRCVGPFYIHGRYSTLNEVRSFHDVFEFDIFASEEKLDGEDFQMQCTGYDYSLLDGVKLNLHFDVYGISDPEDRSDKPSEEEMFDLREKKESYLENRLPTLNELLNHETSEDTYLEPVKSLDELLNGNISEEEKLYTFNEVSDEAVQEQLEETKEITPDDKVDFSMMEELFDDKDNVITSYSFVVVKPEDSYESIAHRYGVDVQKLKDVNHDKALQVKQLIVLPYIANSKQEDKKA